MNGNSINAECQRLVDEAVASGEQTGVQFCAWQDGRLVADVWAGRLSPGGAPVDGDSLFPIFSTGKPLLSTAVHRAVELGLMDYDKPISTWWPEFTGDGKERLTLRETLGYRTGMPGACPGKLKDRDIADWALAVRTAAADKPHCRPGTKQEYLPYAYAWLLGHPLEVAAGKPLDEALRELVLSPAGIEGKFYFAAPRGVFGRIAAYSGNDFCEIMNNDWAREACLPSAWSVSSARALCAFYNRLCGFDGRAPLIRKGTLDEALKPCRDESDPLPSPESLVRDWHMIFGMGYGLWGEYGHIDRVFGHGGAGGSEGLVDRDKRLVVAYTCNVARNDVALRDSLYAAVGMRWRYWKDSVSVQDIQMKAAKDKELRVAGK